MGIIFVSSYVEIKNFKLEISSLRDRFKQKFCIGRVDSNIVIPLAVMMIRISG